MRNVRFQAMGTQCAIHAYGIRAANMSGIRATIAEVDRIEARYSRYLPTNVLSEINRCAIVGGSIEVDEETSALIDFAAHCHQLSNGLFDITSGALRRVWDFRAERVSQLEDIDKVLPLVGFNKLSWQKPVCRSVAHR
jgi:FAD:protein FMN transferase